MPVNINFPAFTDCHSRLASKEAANQFFSAIEVPDAGPGTSGVMEQCPNIPILVPVATVYANVTIINADGSQSQVNVVTQAAFDQLYAAMQTLLANLKSSGIMVGGA